ncbi:fumarylacetoacetate hydrolase family protein [Nanchangia anserum]|uniref:Fumarylacetoacetate hydrolase family protein n=1 Tax=Nanchangia anserum TaxID=2692125 RepID=A0A8I0G8R0_9ACTO|nr:fumarylacetoacetate hydrolase family protein [Nanchangia anserum]MBD3689219.1 fumarylacetoacetate hydrolase family protein [Nanchangia anserum]
MDPVTTHLGHRPGKIFAVHLSYASRAAQRGRTPRYPSYFFKAPSSLAGSGTLERPAGCELIGFEGEVCVIIGTAGRNIAQADAWSHVGWVTAGNDFGLHDMRYADKGSNVRSKSGDGFCPVGPGLIDAATVREDRIGVRTWLDGDLVSDDSTAGMIFPISQMIADLSRLLTLEVGDMIMTGVPAGASVAEPGQVVEVEVFSLDDPSLTSGRLRTQIVEGPALAEVGNPPKVDDTQRSDAWGFPVGTVKDAAARKEPLSEDVRRRLGNVGVGTLSVQLRKRGFNEAILDGVAPLRRGDRLIGPARTLRYVPYRKDLFAAKGGGFNHQKQVVDSLREGEVLVMEARGCVEAGTLGDILALRAKTLGAAGIVTDGAARDSAEVENVGLPVFTGGRHPAVLGRRHVPWEHDVTVSCGGATVCVGDVIVGDDDGAVVIPRDLLDEVLADAEAQEHRERFIAEQVGAGASLDGLFPVSTDEWKARYEEWLAANPLPTP